MKSAYRVLAYLVAAEVVVQAMAMVYAIAGLGKWVDNGGVFDRSVEASDESPYAEFVGFIIHGINGSIVIPVLALALLVCSFFARIRGGAKWAGLVFLLVIVQINLGYAGPGIPVLGALHGLNALALFTAALYTARRARLIEPTAAEQPVSETTTVV